VSPARSFQLGRIIGRLKREIEAVHAYREAILHDPAMADAHWNLSLLRERLGQARDAFRHLLACKRLTQALSRIEQP
jgi:hypothetical protein